MRGGVGKRDAEEDGRRNRRWESTQVFGKHNSTCTCPSSHPGHDRFHWM